MNVFFKIITLRDIRLQLITFCYLFTYCPSCRAV